MNRSIIRYVPPGADNHNHVDMRSSPLVVADGARACYSGSPNIPGLTEYLKCRRINQIKTRMQVRHRAYFDS
jgi:hypothetical protein